MFRLLWIESWDLPAVCPLLPSFYASFLGSHWKQTTQQECLADMDGKSIWYFRNTWAMRPSLECAQTLFTMLLGLLLLIDLRSYLWPLVCSQRAFQLCYWYLAIPSVFSSLLKLMALSLSIVFSSRLYLILVLRLGDFYWPHKCWKIEFSLS
jgi:hypothetical protein